MSYVCRIGLNQHEELSGGPCMNQLQRLMQAQLKTVPFETLDAHFEKRVRFECSSDFESHLSSGVLQISFDVEKIYEKIVNNRRGGFCFELSSLFAWLLSSLNYQVRLVLADVWRKEIPNYLEPCTHLALLVTWPSETATWLVDVRC